MTVYQVICVFSSTNVINVVCALHICKPCRWSLFQHLTFTDFLTSGLSCPVILRATLTSRLSPLRMAASMRSKKCLGQGSVM